MPIRNICERFTKSLDYLISWANRRTFNHASTIFVKGLDCNWPCLYIVPLWKSKIDLICVQSFVIFIHYNFPGNTGVSWSCRNMKLLIGFWYISTFIVGTCYYTFWVENIRVFSIRRVILPTFKEVSCLRGIICCFNPFPRCTFCCTFCTI